MIWVTLALLFFWAMVLLAVIALLVWAPGALLWAVVGMTVSLWIMWREIRKVGVW